MTYPTETRQRGETMGITLHQWLVNRARRSIEDTGAISPSLHAELLSAGMNTQQVEQQIQREQECN